MRSFFCLLRSKGLCLQSQTAIYSSTVCIVPTASEKRFQNASTSVRNKQSSCCMSCARAVQAPIWHICGDAGDRGRRRRGGGESPAPAAVTFMPVESSSSNTAYCCRSPLPPLLVTLLLILLPPRSPLHQLQVIPLQQSPRP